MEPLVSGNNVNNMEDIHKALHELNHSNDISIKVEGLFKINKYCDFDTAGTHHGKSEIQMK